ncbi:RNA cap guanine-N2 methyltransferase-domain-containing protein [Lasiosphaeria miniovina]|uniref:Trimethylguanosine synthase n=1 Tax=Lasiosphaeria miniovina TaxID=1954250 RepID=A0AA40EB42_9PEZI|nr:RNA cap guanine-N2 methyltransferase-domain-containing protein [Lasiosphaeria miniovina]KAK0733475.1 RNA cap guanine-N2 methyltransferase-domain-containing protein [Lasiosphaeria miniovina]
MALTIVHDQLHLTDKCRHYEVLGDVPWDIQKYWHQRYSIFNFYDYDVRLTDEAWFGVTPEPVAKKIAEDLAAWSSSQSKTKNPRTKKTKDTIIDMFGGAGGNVIAFALSEGWARVVAIERDAATLACAQHNAAVYGVREAITFVLGDSLDFMARLRRYDTEMEDGEQYDEDDEVETLLRSIDPARATVFASPPWGGVSYAEHEVFDLSRMEPYSLADLHGACAPLEHTLFLPRSSDLRQVAGVLAPSSSDQGGEKLDVVQYCMNGASKAMVVFVPASESLLSSPAAAAAVK